MSIDVIQDEEWLGLFERIGDALLRLSQVCAFQSEDYWILDDNWGHCRQEIEIRNLELLTPAVIKALQVLLVNYPKWEIAIGVDVVEKYKGWPEMGVIIRRAEVVDGLQRQYFPKEFQAIVYEGRTRKLGAAHSR